MKPFQPASIPESEKDLCVKAIIAQWKANDPEVRAAMTDATDQTIEARARQSVENLHKGAMLFINDKYQVEVRRFCEEILHLSIKRLDRQPIHDWRDLQQIKNEIVGEENEAVELYPAESRLVDTANQFHLYAHVNPEFRFPVGFNDGRIVSNASLGKSVQRPRINV